MRTLARLALALTLVVPLAACDGLDSAVSDAQGAFDDARESVESGLETLRWCTSAFRLGAAVASRDVDAARSAAESLATTAPDELADEVALIIEAAAAAEGSDFSQLRSQEVQDAGRRVLDTAETRCDPTTRPE